jgi:hypothetical protein
MNSKDSWRWRSECMSRSNHSDIASRKRRADSPSFDSIPVKVAIGTMLVVVFSTPASAHCEVGNRVFTATLTIDDPCVEDELSLPTIAQFNTGDSPSAGELDISGEYSKTITENFGVSLDETWIRRQFQSDGSHEGFDNLGTSFKYLFLKDAESQLVMSAALDIEWGGTGSRAVGAEPFTTLTPTLFAGKGFGLLPEPMKLLRPFGVTAQVGYSFPTESSTTAFDAGSGLLTTTRNPQFLVWGGSLQYSMPYLKSYVQDFALPEFVNHLVPIVEWNLETQTSDFDGGERTTGTIDPGLVYIVKKYQLSVEAIIPVNRASGDGVGVIGNLHFFLENIFPHSPLGRPLFGGSQE